MIWKPICTRDGCATKLGWNNRSGFCRKHRRKPKPRTPRKPSTRNPETLKAYREAHKAEIAAYNRAYYLRRTEAIKARVSAWKEANPEKVAEYKRKWDESHPEDKRRHWRESAKRGRSKKALQEVEAWKQTRNRMAA